VQSRLFLENDRASLLGRQEHLIRQSPAEAGQFHSQRLAMRRAGFDAAEQQYLLHHKAAWKEIHRFLFKLF